MKTISKFLLLTMVLLLIGLTTVSAAENVSDTQTVLDIEEINDVPEEITTSDYTQSTINQNETIIKQTNNKIQKTEPATITVTSKNYDQFFNNETEYGDSSDLIQPGDTINLKGNFYNVKFHVDKAITLTSLNKDAYLYNCTVHIIGENSSNSIVSNLHIQNNGSDDNPKPGIQARYTNNITVKNNYVYNLGMTCFDFVGDHFYNSTIQSNYFEREGDDYKYVTFIMGNADYNHIDNNTIVCGGANGIYLSIYGRMNGKFDAGECHHNLITNNKLTARGVITSWCYLIQIMGTNNTVSHNTVEGGFRGISIEGYRDNIVTYNDVHSIYTGIYAASNAYVAHNYIHVNESARGIQVAGTEVIVEDNEIHSTNGAGIDIITNYANIKRNNITTTGGPGIYSKGEYYYFTIENNRINSVGEGIAIKWQSTTKRPNNILINKNTIVSKADYAINLEETGNRDINLINITVTTSNVISSAKGQGLGLAYLPPKNTNNTNEADGNFTLTITEANYDEWFTDGQANTNITQNATITLQGTFTDKNFIFPKKVHIIGKNAVIINGTITLIEDAHQSTITNVKINNSKNEENTKHGIELINVNNCEITNVNIDNYGVYESLGIFIYDSSGSKITKNTIKTSGDYINNGILVYSSELSNIENNIIYINQTNNRTPYADSLMFNERIGTIQEVLHNHGIILIYSSDNIINNNTINVTSEFKTYTYPENDCKNSIVGIDMYFNCHNNMVSNNIINIKSYGPYAYGMGVLGGQWGTSISSSSAVKNTFKSNTVTVEGGYFATGFIAGRNSVNTTLDSNTFNLKAVKDSKTAGDFVHGITLENSTSTTVNNNTLTANAASIYGIQMFDSSDNIITYNNVKATANNPYAIAGYRASNNKITNNTITTRKVNNGDSTPVAHSDTITAGDDAIYMSSTSSSNTIKYNTIDTNASATVKLDEQARNNIVEENSLKNKSFIGDLTVIKGHSSNSVKNNFLYFVNVTVYPVYATIGDNITLEASISSTTTDTSNLTATFIVGVNTVGTSKVTNGKASIPYTVSTLLKPTTYQLFVNVGGTNFQNSTGGAQASFNGTIETPTVTVDKVLATVGSNATLKAHITRANGGKVGSGFADFYIDNTKLSTVRVSLGEASYVYNVGTTSGIHTIKVVYLGTNDYAEAEATNTLGIQSDTTISLSDLTATLGKSTTIKATIKTGGTNLASGTATIKIANTTIGSTTISNGAISYTYTIANTFNKGEYQLTVNYAGTDTIAPATSSSKITINPYTPTFYFNTTTVKVNDSVSLVVGIDNGLTESSKYLANGGNVSIKLNGQTLTDSNNKAITGSIVNGQLTFKFTAPQELLGNNNISFIYDGNSKFASGSKTYTNGFVVKTAQSDTLIPTIDKINAVIYNENVTITGKFLDTNNIALANKNVQIVVNGVSNTVKTNANGAYSIIIKATAVGTNTVTVSYDGDSVYKKASTSSTFTVNKKPTKITITKPTNIVYNDNVTLTGKFTDEDGNNLIYTPLMMKLNNENINVTTNANGEYSYTYKATTTGTTNVVVSYAGNTKYNATSTSISYVVNKKPTKITINIPTSIVYNDNVTISGTFTDEDGNKLIYTPLMMKLNNENINLTTTGTGSFTYTYQATTVEKTTVIISYAGNTKYAANSTSISFNVNKKPTKLTIDNPGKVIINDNVTITGKFTDENGNNLIYTNVKLTINGVTYNLTTNNKGVYSYSYVATTAGTIPVSVSYAGNAKYAATNTSMNLVVSKKPCIITIDNPGKVIINDNVTITGKFTDENGNALIYSNVKLTINGETYNLTTNNKGVYSYVYQATTAGTNNVSVLYPGNAKYTNASDNISFNVNKKSTKLTIDDIATTPLNSNVTITGKFTNDEGTALINSNVAVTINGVKYTVKTNNKGIYSYTYKTTILGTNNVTVSYPGNNKYDNTSVSTSFKVGKKSTKLTINTPTKVYYNDIITFTGKFTNDDGAALINSNVVLTINGIKHTIKTDSNGVYSYDYKANTTGTNNVTISYPGNTKYENTSTSIKFNVDKKTTKLTINTPTKVYYNDIITFTGKFTNGDGAALVNSNVVLTINGAKHTIKTDSNGAYSYDYKANTTGTNNVTISYAGNAKYANTSKTINFDVTKKDTKLTINTPKNTKYNDNVTFTGKFTNNDGTALINSKVVLTINGEKHTLTTNNQGMYNFTYKATIVGTNNITISYGGNAKYNACTTSIKLVVAKKDTKMTVNKISNVKKNTNVTITGKFINADGSVLSNSKVSVVVNNEKFSVTTNKQGVYTLSYTAITTGTNNVTVSYPGNNKYNSCTTSTSFTVTG